MVGERAPTGILAMMGVASLLAGCAAGPPVEGPSITAAQARAEIDRSIPRAVSDRSGWAADLYAGFTALAIEPSRDNICAVVAVIQQESGFHVDPVVPGLGVIAWREIDARAERAGVPQLLLHSLLQLKSSTGRTYGERIDRARTEKELSDIYEDFIGAVPLGQPLFADRNPIRTRGPMQVNVAFAEQYAALKTYPYPVRVSIADEVFTRRGSLYFGIAHLLDYPAAYDRYLYRFADYNAGQYASRNAAFQSAVSSASGIALASDGALLPHGAAIRTGDTELALRAMAGRLNLSESAIHSSLEQARTKGFELTPLYRRVFELADQSAARPLPHELVPHIQLHGPKLTRSLTTAWYANRVEERFERCLTR
jgi:hypothetical protein